MDSESFNVIQQYILEPVLKQVESELKAVFTQKNYDDAFKLIYNKYVFELSVFRGAMKKSVVGLDAHKKASCLCGAIMKSEILEPNPEIMQYSKQQFLMHNYYPNELYAFYCALQLLKINLMHNVYKDDLDAAEQIDVEFPYFPKIISDKHTYLSNTICYLREYAHERHNDILYDRFSYSSLLFHLDKENREYFNKRIKKMRSHETA